MKNTALIVILTVVIMIVVGSLALGALATLGAVNVAASADYLPGAEWFFSTLSENSIRRQAQKSVGHGRISPPAQITQSMLDNGQHHFVEMCVVCHGAPGIERGEIGAGQKPLPPELSRTAAEMTIEQIYWVIEHGIRHTGMPAFGETHSADDLWAIAAFVEQLETMSPEEYKRLTGGQPRGTSHEMSPDEPDMPAAEHDHSGHTH